MDHSIILSALKGFSWISLVHDGTSITADLVGLAYLQSSWQCRQKGCNLFQSQCNHRIHTYRAPRRDKANQHRNDRHHARRCKKLRRIQALHSVEIARKQPSDCRRSYHADCDSDYREFRANIIISHSRLWLSAPRATRIRFLAYAAKPGTTTFRRCRPLRAPMRARRTPQTRM